MWYNNHILEKEVIVVEVLNLIVRFLSSIVEAFLIIYFCKHIGGIYKIKIFYDSVILGTVLCILYYINVPFGRQILYLLFLILYFTILKYSNIKKSIIFILLGVFLILIFETVYCIPTSYILGVNFSLIEEYKKLIILLPIRLIQYLVIHIMWRCNMGVLWWGNLEEIESTDEKSEDEEE